MATSIIIRHLIIQTILAYTTSEHRSVTGAWLLVFTVWCVLGHGSVIKTNLFTKGNIKVKNSNTTAMLQLRQLNDQLKLNDQAVREWTWVTGSLLY